MLEVPAPDRVDIVLEPDPELAFEKLRTWQIWGEEVVLPDVPVPRDK